MSAPLLPVQGKVLKIKKQGQVQSSLTYRPPVLSKPKAPSQSSPSPQVSVLTRDFARSREEVGCPGTEGSKGGSAVYRLKSTLER